MGSEPLPKKEKLFPVTSQLQSLFICGSVSKKTVARLCPRTMGNKAESLAGEQKTEKQAFHSAEH